jgi:NAD(P)-dependent dehydrogenase (short-subunit alcohol dehydrogenase family)
MAAAGPPTDTMSYIPELSGRCAVITGGANGIGAAIVRAFHAQGARIFFCDRDAKAGQALANELGGDVHFTRVSLCEEQEICRWISQIGAQAKAIDVLVNNAAADSRRKLAKTTAANWDELFALNLRAYFLICREASPFMPKGGASVINLASITFHIAPPEMSAYVATKGGILGFTRSLARELGPRRIRVNTVSPGWTMTERQLRQFVTPAVKRLIRRSQCIPELIQPAEIAEVVLFLASDASRAITGQEILVDRGWAHS